MMQPDILCHPDSTSAGRMHFYPGGCTFTLLVMIHDDVLGLASPASSTSCCALFCAAHHIMHLPRPVPGRQGSVGISARALRRLGTCR